MGSIIRFIKRHDLVMYFVLAYTIAWGISFAVWALNEFDAAQLQISDIMVMFLAMLLGPSPRYVYRARMPTIRPPAAGMTSNSHKWER